MKGAGISTGSVVIGRVGGVSNVGVRGASSIKMGGSSIERGFGGGNSAFSSRGLSMFNREAISKPSSSIINPNFGKGAKSPHARIPGLASPKGMFDVSRPLRSSSVLKPAEFGVRVNIKNGTERVSKTARSAAIAPRGIFDVSRPARTSPIERSLKSTPRQFEFGKKITPARSEQVRSPRLREIPLGKSENRAIRYDKARTVAVRTREVGLNPRVRAERVKSIFPRETIILWSRQENTAKASEKTIVTTTVREQSRPQDTIRGVVSKTQEVKAIKRKKEMVLGVKKEKTLPKRKMRVGHMVSVMPHVSEDERLHIYADIKRAQNESVHIIRRARKVSYNEALMEATKALETRHKGKIVITPHEPQIVPDAVPQTQPEVKTQADSKTQTITLAQLNAESKHQLDTQARAQAVSGEKTKPESKTEKKPQVIEADSLNSSVEAKKLQFKKDEKANKGRVKRIFSAIEKIASKQGKTIEEMSGNDVVLEMGSFANPQELSELTRLQGFDYRWNKLIDSIKNIRGFLTPKHAEQVIASHVEEYSAVKLAEENDPSAGAIGQDAVEVYGAPLDGVRAHVEEENSSDGELSAHADTQRVLVLVNGRRQVIYKGEESEKIHLAPQAA